MGRKMTSKYFLMACFAGALIAQGVTIAEAQTPGARAPTPPKLITPEAHRIATNGGTIQSGKSSTSAERQFTHVGWQYFHATNCITYYDGVTNWVYVYPAEGGFWFTSNAYLATTFLNQCTAGNWVAIYVSDTA